MSCSTTTEGVGQTTKPFGTLGQHQPLYTTPHNLIQVSDETDQYRRININVWGRILVLTMARGRERCSTGRISNFGYSGSNRFEFILKLVENDTFIQTFLVDQVTPPRCKTLIMQMNTLCSALIRTFKILKLKEAFYLRYYFLIFRRSEWIPLINPMTSTTNYSHVQFAPTLAMSELLPPPPLLSPLVTRRGHSSHIAQFYWRDL